jgi:hypothetical protein
MGDEDRSRELPQRARGGSDRSAPSVSPVLSEEVRQRIQAAVKAEREGTAAKDQQDATKAADQSQRASIPGPADSPVKSPAANGYHGQRKRAAKPEHPAKPSHAAKSRRSARPERPAEYERNTESQPVAETEPVVKPLPARDVSANRKPTAQGQVRTPEQAQTDQAVPPEATAPEGPRGQHFGKVRLVAWAVVFITIGALGVVISRHIVNSPNHTGATNTALRHQELEARKQAASWVAQQVDPADIVSCDRVMCAALAADRFPSRNLRVLQPASFYPVGSAVIVETAAVRSQFGTSLAAAYAPAALASFGAGIAEISVRVIAPHGAGAYQAALSADRAARMNSGSGLANNTNRIAFAGATRNQLAAGQVDARLMLAITGLAGHRPISILRFENIAPGGDADMPLRFADLAENDTAVHMSNSAYLKSMTTFLAARYPSARTEIATEGRQSVFRIEFTAPSPLGVFGGP